MKKFLKKRANLEERLKKFEQTLSISPEDSTALKVSSNVTCEIIFYLFCYYAVTASIVNY